jgi:hypothetical protein
VGVGGCADVRSVVLVAGRAEWAALVICVVSTLVRRVDGGFGVCVVSPGVGGGRVGGGVRSLWIVRWRLLGGWL